IPDAFFVLAVRLYLLLLIDEFSKVLMNDPKLFLHVFSKLDEFARELLCFNPVVRLPVIEKGCLRVLDFLQLLIPVIPIRKAAEKDEDLGIIVGADAIHLVAKNSLVELEDSLSQTLQGWFEGLVHGDVLPEMFSQIAIPVHPGNNVSDARMVGSRRFRG